MCYFLLRANAYHVLLLIMWYYLSCATTYHSRLLTISLCLRAMTMLPNVLPFIVNAKAISLSWLNQIFILWRYRRFERTQHGLRKNTTVESIHGSLFVVGKLLRWLFGFHFSYHIGYPTHFWRCGVLQRLDTKVIVVGTSDTKVIVVGMLDTKVIFVGTLDWVFAKCFNYGVGKIA